MIKTKLSELAKQINGTLHGSDLDFTAISTDTRTLEAGQLFWVIRGPQFDAHQFIEQAQAKGAIASVVDHAIETTQPFIVVKDTRHALGEFAKHHRQRFNLPVIAVTGSCGKTTTKALMSSIFSLAGSTLCPEQSFNNEIGLPLTLLRLNEMHHYAILELGSNHPGEIAVLTAIAQPLLAGITNIAPVHVEGFGDLQGIAREKRSIFQGLDPSGIAIINIDEPLITDHLTLLPSQKKITFGLHSSAQITAKEVSLDIEGQLQFCLITPQDQGKVKLKLLGEHNLNNALFAAAAAYALEIPFKTIIQGLEDCNPVGKRLNRLKGLHDSVIINDGYNANPTAIIAAINLLAGYRGRRILVLADMAELGPQAKHYHYQVGEAALNAGIDMLYTLGELSEYAAQGFGSAARHYRDRQRLIVDLKSELQKDVTVLVKGSKPQRMWEIAEALLN